MLLTACASDGENKPAATNPGDNAPELPALSEEITETAEPVIDDGSYEIFMPTTVYFSEENTLDDANTIEYDEYGNMTKFHIVNEFTSKHEPSEIKTDENGRVTSVKNWHRDEYYFTYDEDGNTTQITGEFNFGNNRFEFRRSEKEGAAYELITYREKDFLVEQYDEDYKLLEQLYTKFGSGNEPFHRRYYTYTDDGKISKWVKTYDERYDFTDTYTAEDFDEMGHCLPQYLINGANFQYTEYVRNWESTVEKDANGRVIKDTHACADEPKFVITYEYEYEGDDIASYSYIVYEPETESYKKTVYEPIKVKCDDLQLALIMIYAQDAYANNFGSFRSLTVDWTK